MWFRNLSIHRLGAFSLNATELSQALAKHAFHPGTTLEMQTTGWASPRDNGELVHAVERQMLLTLRTEKRLLPASVVNQVTKARAAELEEQQGFKPGRKQLKELKEQITEELLPRAFSIRSDTRVWIDPINGWLVIDAASAAKADEVRGMLFKSVDALHLTTLQVNLSPVAAMTEWVSGDEAPEGFTIDQDIELQSSAESKPTVRYARHPLDVDDIGRHIAAGKRCTKLAMTWNDRVSFVLTEGLIVKRVAPLDVLKEGKAQAATAEETFDGDFLLMAGELNGLLRDLVDSLGSERAPEGINAEASARNDGDEVANRLRNRDRAVEQQPAPEPA
ncbi:recombination-associated protein RdgC [Cupriavidus nantongensis]|uniref:recombination-associated protein RdgC n=1 Tax=Cupriavidus nantongensis TaxID=1796606 RepID=UPI0009EDD3D9|nr:recombination-associated protein RdgC [Cupriavidus nantongensis]